MKRKTKKPKRATRRELLCLLRNLYGDLTSSVDDEGAVIDKTIDLAPRPGWRVDNVVIWRPKLKPHLAAISQAMDLEDEHNGSCF